MTMSDDDGDRIRSAILTRAYAEVRHSYPGNEVDHANVRGHPANLVAFVVGWVEDGGSILLVGKMIDEFADAA
jgi:hypothetical protein